MKLEVLDDYCDYQVKQNKLSNHHQRDEIDAGGYRLWLVEVIEVNFGPAIICQYYKHTQKGLCKRIVSRFWYLTWVHSLGEQLHTNEDVGEDENEE